MSEGAPRSLKPKAEEGIPKAEKSVVKKEILESISDGFESGVKDNGRGVNFTEFANRIKEYEQNGVLSPDDVAEIYSSRKVQKAVKEVFLSLYMNAGYSVDSYPEKPGSFLNKRSWVLYPEDSPEGKAVREAAAQRLAEFLEAGVIDERQAQKIREDEFYKKILS